jgi:hypothetical protein
MDEEIGISEVEEAIKKTKAGKAAGLDGNSPELLKAALVKRKDADTGEETDSPLLSALVRLANAVWGADVLPDELLTAVITPIPKGNADPTVQGNTRSISLVPVALKLVSKIVNDRISDALEQRQFFVREQGGFRTREETVAQVAALLELAQ